MTDLERVRELHGDVLYEVRENALGRSTDGAVDAADAVFDEALDTLKEDAKLRDRLKQENADSMAEIRRLRGALALAEHHIMLAHNALKKTTRAFDDVDRMNPDALEETT